jgi:hypothetical protein
VTPALPREERDAIRSRAEAATPGPWSAYGSWPFEVIGDAWDPDGGRQVLVTGTEGREADSHFAAHARTDVPALLDALDAAEAETAHAWQHVREEQGERDEARAERDTFAARLDKLRAGIEAWIRHGEAVPDHVTTYQRWIVHEELKALLAADGAGDNSKTSPSDAGGMSKPHMTDAQGEALNAYIGDLAARMGLGHWDIYVGSEIAAKDTNAHVDTSHGREVAWICFPRRWWKRSPEERRNDVVHELIHVVHRPQTNVVRVALRESGYLPKRAFRILWATFTEHTEVMVDHLAAIIAPTMPLLDDPDAAEGP